MKRALVVGTGTVVGVAAVLALNPDGTVASVPAASSASSGSTAGSSAAGTSSGSTADGSSSSQAYAGSSVDIGHGYGTIAVEITVTDGRLVDITALELPQNDHHSLMISQQAWPTLVSEAIEAQSADISGVSGATYTSQGFVASLRDALTQAGLS